MKKRSYTYYNCVRCSWEFTIRPGEITTADIKTHCGLPMNVYTLEQCQQPIACDTLRTHTLGQPDQPCGRTAHWQLAGHATCDECLVALVEQLPDNRQKLRLALHEILARRYLGARVRIACGQYQGKLGTIDKRSDVTFTILPLEVIVDGENDGSPIPYHPNELELVACGTEVPQESVPGITPSVLEKGEQR